MQLKHLGKATPVINIFYTLRQRHGQTGPGLIQNAQNSHLPRQYAETPVRRKHVIKHPDAQKKRKKDLEV